MFGKSVTDPVVGERVGHSVIQEGVVIRGDLEAKGDLRLDGRVEGRVTVSEKLTIGEKGAVMAEIDAGEVVVMGQVQGAIKAHRRLELRKGAKVVGDISTPILLVEEGVHFHGNSNMEVEKTTSPLLRSEPKPTKLPPSAPPPHRPGDPQRPRAVSGGDGFR